VSTPAFEMKMEPSFFLSTAGENKWIATPLACWERARLRDLARDDHMLVEIEPPVIGQNYGLGNQDTTNLILSTRHEGFFTLFDQGMALSHLRVAHLGRRNNQIVDLHASANRNYRLGHNFPNSRRSERPRQNVPGSLKSNRWLCPFATCQKVGSSAMTNAAQKSAPELSDEVGQARHGAI
jgi:hypothetical protein